MIDFQSSKVLRPCPSGTFENSPALQGWVNDPTPTRSPAGTTEALFHRTFGIRVNSCKRTPGKKHRNCKTNPIFDPTLFRSERNKNNFSNFMISKIHHQSGLPHGGNFPFKACHVPRGFPRPFKGFWGKIIIISESLVDSNQRLQTLLAKSKAIGRVN
jgi:hypothetical protein